MGRVINLDKAMKIINARLPKSYLIPVKTYKTIYNLIRAYCNMEELDYNKTVAWYGEYISNVKTNTYIKTKYWRRNIGGKKPYKKGLNFSAISTNPIMVAEDMINDRTVIELVYLIIHELGHIWLERKGKEHLDERWCDQFAIRWCQRMKREQILKEEYCGQ